MLLIYEITMINCPSERAFNSLRAKCLALLCFLLGHAAFAQPSNGVLREFYGNIAGSTIPDLTNAATFPNSPTSESLEPIFEAPSNIADSYGTRMRALLTAPTTGNYIFWIASDDQGYLYLSTDETPAHKRLICAEPQWGASRDWDSTARRTGATAIFPAMNPNLPANRSDNAYGTITLNAGQRYYIEALQKEGGGGDNLAVGWQLPNTTQERPIPGNRVAPFGLGPPVIIQQPANTTVIEGGYASFSVTLTHMIGAAFQWLRNGTNVPGATNSTFTIGPVALGDNSNTFGCFIANSYGTTNSSNALLTVLADTTPPTISTVGNLGEPQIVFVVFSEPVEAASGTNAANYTINNGISVLRASFGVDFRTIILTTTPIPPNLTNTLTVNNVRDRASTPNTIPPNTQRTFSLTLRPLNVALLPLPRETLGPSTHRQGVVISEVMYHPTNRTDGRNLEFIEIYNSQAWYEELGGWRISGAIDFSFPSNTVLQSNSFLIVAANPTDFRAVYSFTNVFGPFANSNSLQNSSGNLRLRNSSDAIVFDMSYSGDPPFPVAADGTGHSLVLARPSYGESDPRAWEASSALGGNPGAPDVPQASTLQKVFINEFLAHTDPPQLDYIELYNYGDFPLNIGGCALSDDPATNKFLVPTNTVIRSRGFIVFTETDLGFSLSASGESLFFRQPVNNRVIDAVRFGSQQNGVALGRYPDGAPGFSRLVTPTPGTNNAPIKTSDVVINEIMYDPISADSNDEYIELYNRSTNAVNLSDWHIRDAVSFNIPTPTILPAGGYLVIAKNAAHLRTNYPNLTPANTLGNFSGSLPNGGGHLELNMPDQLVGTNALGQPKISTIHPVVDEITYAPGGRWGAWAGGGGSSLELRDARGDHRLAQNWGSSDESKKSPWVNVEFTGVMDNGWADAYQLHVTLLDAGEALIDNVEVIPAAGTNLISNGTFENGASGWVFQGGHNQTSWEPAEGYNSAHSLHLRATAHGDTGSNRVRTQLPYTIPPGTTVTLRAKVRWLKGSPNILLRLRGNWLEAPGNIVGTHSLGTPGAPNSIAVPNAGPAIADVRHSPVLPASGQQVLVQARVSDPDGLAYLAVNYRLDPSTNYLTVAMTNNGAGFYSTVIPGQPSGVGGAFYIQAIDGSGTPAGSTFPDDAPGRECILRWGDPASPGSLAAYRFWISQTNVNRWTAEEKKSNNPKDITFIYGGTRVIYNAGGMFHGSPYHAPGYDSPVGNSCDYDLVFPDDDTLLGDTGMGLLRPGNGGGDATAQDEIQAFWFASQFGLPFNYDRPVFGFVNGQRREVVFLDAQRPGGDWVAEWYPNDTKGELHKVQLGFEFGDQGFSAGEQGYSVVGADLNRYTTTGGLKKLARYRQTWPLHGGPNPQQNNYTNIFKLVDATMTGAVIGSDAYNASLTNATDVEEWFKIHVTQHLYNNYDSFSYGGGQNAYAYKPQFDTWKLLLWDVDFAFGGDPNDANLFGIGSNEHGPRNDHPPFARLYWQALIEAANGFLTAARSNPILDARYNGMVAGGAAIGSPQGIKDFIATKRNLVLSQIANNQSSFAITTSGGADFTTGQNLLTLTGTAPLGVRTILINGAAYPVTWTALNTWSVRISLMGGTNTLLVTANDPKGVPVAGASKTIHVNYTGPTERPQDKIAINEIMYHPVFANASYVELYNSSASNSFDLSGWRLDGVGLTFASGTVLAPGSYKVVTKDPAVFAATYGSSIPVLAQFPGNLNPDGETLTLIQPGPTPAQDVVIDQVTYDRALPWSSQADGAGASLQLMDPTQDHNRVANWAPQLTNAPSLWQYVTTNGTASSSELYIYLTAAGDVYVDDIKLVAGNVPEAGSNVLANGDFESAFPGPYVVGTNLAASTISTTIKHSGNASLHLVASSPGVNKSTTIYQDITPPLVTNGTYTLSFWYLPATNSGSLSIRLSSGTVHALVNLAAPVTTNQVALLTPGVGNTMRTSVPPFPPLWLNEVLPNNFFVGTNGIADSFGQRDPWVELYNGGSNTLDLSSYYLSDDYANLAQWSFPSNTTIGPKQFLLVWTDGQPEQSSSNELHASFRLAPDSGSVILSRGSNFSAILDYLNYNIPVAGRSYGSFPDGAVSGRRLFSIPTPSRTNNSVFPSIDVRINEWMADNLSTLRDPTGGQFDDWFELYNPGADDVDLSGYYLSDNLANTTQSPITVGATLPAGGYLLVWADGVAARNNPTNADLHVNFSLSKHGEVIGLFAPDGKVIDAVTFGAQTSDVSQGRFPDGGASIAFMTNPTPRSANYIYVSNAPPTLAPLHDQTADEGVALSFSAVATDSDQPSQNLTFTLDPGAPSGASIDPVSGLFSWTPTGQQGPGVYPITIRVTDNGTPSLSATQSINITVREVNNPPVLAPILSQSIPEGSTLTATNSATDPDNPPQLLTFSLGAGKPDGMTIDPATGVITWTPTEAQGPGTYTVSVIATDNGMPPLSDSKAFSVLVNEVNSPPQISFPSNWTVRAGTTLSFSAIGADSDLPAQKLTFTLDPGAPSAAQIDPANGLFTWTPADSNAGTNSMVIRVTDDGTPPASAFGVLRVVVLHSLRANLSLTGTAATITFETIVGRTYRVESKTNLNDAAWSPVGTNTVATTSVLTIQDNLSHQRFYRLLQLD